MSDVRPVEIVDDEGFIAIVPCKIEGILRSIAYGAAPEGVNDVEAARQADGVVEERALEGIAVLDEVIDASRGVREVFILLVGIPAIFFSQHSKLEQMSNNIVFLIINNI
jgi:hypothetical protein